MAHTIARRRSHRARRSLKRFLGLYLRWPLPGALAGASPSPRSSPLHDVYEATNVALPDGSGSGSIVFAFSENGTAGSPVSGEIVLVAAVAHVAFAASERCCNSSGFVGDDSGITSESPDESDDVFERLPFFVDVYVFAERFNHDERYGRPRVVLH